MAPATIFTNSQFKSHDELKLAINAQLLKHYPLLLPLMMDYMNANKIATYKEISTFINLTYAMNREDWLTANLMFWLFVLEYLESDILSS